jgi:hypothetical protein
MHADDCTSEKPAILWAPATFCREPVANAHSVNRRGLFATMDPNEIQGLFKQHFGQQPGFDANAAQQVSTALAAATSTIAQTTGSGANNNPTPTQQQCYATCQATRDAALAAAAAQGWPMGVVAAGAAIMAFNACRHNCDQNP